MKTWNLTLTPPGGPVTTHEGLTESETREALYDLMHGRDARPLAVASREAAFSG